MAVTLTAVDAAFVDAVGRVAVKLLLDLPVPFG
jgi:hypothetical protein